MGGASVHLVTDERIEASKTEVCPWSKGEQGPVLGADGPAEGSPPRLFTELDSNSSTLELGEAGGERRRGCRGECDLQILPQGRRQKLIPSLQDAKKAGRGL